MNFVQYVAKRTNRALKTIDDALKCVLRCVKYDAAYAVAKDFDENCARIHCSNAINILKDFQAPGRRGERVSEKDKSLIGTYIEACRRAMEGKGTLQLFRPDLTQQQKLVVRLLTKMFAEGIISGERARRYMEDPAFKAIKKSVQRKAWLIKNRICPTLGGSASIAKTRKSLSALEKRKASLAPYASAISALQAAIADKPPNLAVTYARSLLKKAPPHCAYSAHRDLAAMVEKEGHDMFFIDSVSGKNYARAAFATALISWITQQAFLRTKIKGRTLKHNKQQQRLLSISKKCGSLWKRDDAEIQHGEIVMNMSDDKRAEAIAKMGLEERDCLKEACISRAAPVFSDGCATCVLIGKQAYQVLGWAHQPARSLTLAIESGLDHYIGAGGEVHRLRSPHLMIDGCAVPLHLRITEHPVPVARKKTLEPNRPFFATESSARATILVGYDYFIDECRRAHHRQYSYHFFMNVQGAPRVIWADPESDDIARYEKYLERDTNEELSRKGARSSRKPESHADPIKTQPAKPSYALAGCPTPGLQDNGLLDDSDSHEARRAQSEASLLPRDGDVEMNPGMSEEVPAQRPPPTNLPEAPHPVDEQRQNFWKKKGGSTAKSASSRSAVDAIPVAVAVAAEGSKVELDGEGKRKKTPGSRRFRASQALSAVCSKAEGTSAKDGPPVPVTPEEGRARVVEPPKEAPKPEKGKDKDVPSCLPVSHPVNGKFYTLKMDEYHVLPASTQEVVHNVKRQCDYFKIGAISYWAVCGLFLWNSIITQSPYAPGSKSLVPYYVGNAVASGVFAAMYKVLKILFSIYVRWVVKKYARHVSQLLALQHLMGEGITLRDFAIAVNPVVPAAQDVRPTPQHVDPLLEERGTAIIALNVTHLKYEDGEVREFQRNYQYHASENALKQSPSYPATNEPQEVENAITRSQIKANLSTGVNRTADDAVADLAAKIMAYCRVCAGVVPWADHFQQPIGSRTTDATKRGI